MIYKLDELERLDVIKEAEERHKMNQTHTKKHTWEPVGSDSKNAEEGSVSSESSSLLTEPSSLRIETMMTQTYARSFIRMVRD